MAGEDDNTSITNAAEPASTAPDTAAVTNQGETTAPTPSAEPSGETHESLLDAVQKAVPELRTSRDDEPGEGSQGATPAPTAKTDADPELPDEVTPEELAKYAPSAKRRVERLLRERSGLKAQVDQLKSIEPSARAADSVSTFLRQNDIGRDDFLLTLELAAAMRRGDFQTFYAGIQPYVKLAEEYLGITLPPDLAQRVREGHMTTQAAAAFSRERMDRAIAQHQGARGAQQIQAQQTHFQNVQQEQAREVLANQVRDTVNAWEAGIARSDPDYAAKRAAVQDTMWAVVRERGAPQSPDQAVAIAQESLRRVNERYNAWTPPKRPTSRTPSSTGRSTGAAPEPKSLMDVVRQARETARV